MWYPGKIYRRLERFYAIYNSKLLSAGQIGYFTKKDCQGDGSVDKMVVLLSIFV